MWIETLFLLLFLMQIIVLSYYCPILIIRSVDFIFNNYPPQTHSLLYPNGPAKAKRWKRVFTTMHICIMLVSVVVYAVVVTAVINGNPANAKLGFVPLLVFLLHMVPFVYLSVSTLIGLKHMRSANNRTLRIAGLRPRTLFSFVSPVRLFFTIAMFLLCIFVTLHVNHYTLDDDVLWVLISLALSHSLFFCVAYFGIYGKSLNPHQSTEDRFIEVGRTVSIITQTSLLVNIYLILLLSMKYYSPDSWAGFGVINCTYCLLIGYLSRYSPANLKDMDFDVYKTPTEDLNPPVGQAK